jgi:hypothetical protein
VLTVIKRGPQLASYKNFVMAKFRVHDEKALKLIKLRTRHTSTHQPAGDETCHFSLVVNDVEAVWAKSVVLDRFFF